MKKVATIFLTVVYLASFAGIFISNDCTVHASNNFTGSAVQFVQLPGKAPAHQSDHPLLQFCKAVAFHKEVLRTAKIKHWRPFETVPASITYDASVSQAPLSPFQARYNDRLPKKLFLHNRVLLI